MAGKSYTITKLAPNSKLVQIKGFGSLLFGCPSEIVKPLIKTGTFPDFTVITLRTLRQGRNLIDVEFLFYVHLFLKKGNDTFRFICTRSQGRRIKEIISEALFGPAMSELLYSMLPDRLVPENVSKMEFAKYINRRISHVTGLRQRFNEMMKAHWKFNRVVRGILNLMPGFDSLSEKDLKDIARAWVNSSITHNECLCFSKLFKRSKREVLDLLDFTLFDASGESVVQNRGKQLKVKQPRPCFFQLETQDGECFDVDLTENEHVRVEGRQQRKPFIPPEFGVTFIGAGTGFATEKHATSSIIWAGGRGIGVDMIAESVQFMRQLGISRSDVKHIILTHTHSDHDAGLIQRIMAAEKIKLLTSRVIFDSFLRKAEAVTCLPQSEFAKLVDFIELKPGRERKIPGMDGVFIKFDYSFHPIPTGRMVVFYRKENGERLSIGISGDTLYNPKVIEEIYRKGIITPERREVLLDFLWDADLIIHEAGGEEIHTSIDDLHKLPDEIKKKLRLNHIPDRTGTYKGMKIAGEGQTEILYKGKGIRKETEYASTLKSTELFDRMSADEINAVLKKGSIRKVNAGTHIVKEGERGDEFFIILSGLVQIQKQGIVVNEYEKGDFFGELAILSPDRKRKATVAAQTDVILFVMDEDLYHQYRLPDVVEENLYKLVNFFTETTDSTLMSSLVKGDIEHFSRGEDIILVGTDERTVYILLSGSVEVLDRKKKRLAVLEDVDIFGEIALMENVRRTATVRARDDVKVLSLTENQFRQILSKFPSFYATVLQKKKKRLRKHTHLNTVLDNMFGFS